MDVSKKKRLIAIIALVIVIIAIVIIKIGVPSAMLVYDSSSDAMDEAIDKMSEQEIQMFNSQFTIYEGKVKGSNVKALVQRVNSNNSSSGKQITLNLPSEEISVTQEYNVQFSYDNEGYIKEVKIDKVNGIINIVY